MANLLKCRNPILDGLLASSSNDLSFRIQQKEMVEPLIRSSNQTKAETYSKPFETYKVLQK